MDAKLEKGLTIYFIRHGETYFNLHQRTQGWVDPFLTPKGIEDMRQVGKRLSRVRFDAAIVSDLKRTTRTAEILLGESIYPRWMVPIRELADFREISFGSFEGMTANETWEILRQYLGFPSVEAMLNETTEAERLSALKPADLHGEGEDYQDYLAHLHVGADKLLDELGDTDATLLFVGHSINIRHILQYLIPKEDHIPELYDMYSMKNGGVITINNQSGKFKIHQYMDKFYE